MIELKNIQVCAGSFCLQNISLSLEAGKFHVLLGPSGSGKTLLLETIAGLLFPQKGSIYFNQIDITNLVPEKRGLSYLPQESTLFPHINVFENIGFGLKLNKKISGYEYSNRVLRIAQMLSITHLLDRSVRHLSGGERQRVALARALVLERPILILDEPTSSLQETMQENFCLLLKEIQQDFNLTVLMTTHHKDSAFMLADTIHFLDNGYLDLSIDVSQIDFSPLPLNVANLLDISNILSMEKIPDQKDFYFCPELNVYFKLPEVSAPSPSKFQLGIRPSDIQVSTTEIGDQTNHFPAVVLQILLKSGGFLVFLSIPTTGFVLKMELSRLQFKELRPSVGDSILCFISAGNTRLVY